LIALEPAPSYDPALVERAVGAAFKAVERDGALIRPGAKVFVKVNNLSSRRDPSSAVNTHPAVLRAVLRLLLERGAAPVVGDDVNAGREDPFRAPGLRAVCDELAVKLVNLREAGFREVRCEGRRLRSLFVARAALEADVILNVPKLKTHSLTGLTCAVKNMFGVIPAGERHRLHGLFPLNDPFCEALVDIFAAVRPFVTICDAVVAMEGEGPSGGRPRSVGAILASRDAIALDAAAASLVGIEPLAVATTRIGHERGLGRADLEGVAFSGAQPGAFRIPDFKHSALAFSFLRKRLPASLYAWVQGQLVLTPKVVRSRCTFCGDCLAICPPRAVHERAGTAWVDAGACIHCLCCHEACPSLAIRLRRTRFGRLAHALAGAWARVSGRAG
jgi:uncharacterized protein (DUF362 family)/ferredoxin